MGKEIEYKFLVDAAGWRPQGAGTLYRQGYVNSAIDRTVRVRIAGDAAFLTVKGATKDIERAEFEYPIPLADAQEMLDTLCEKPLIEKTRHIEIWQGERWEIDVFHGENDGLIVAEIEVGDVTAAIHPPPWATRNVSGDARYFNSSLIANPYRNWRSKNPA